jgi:recombinational DNA repair ATPase RecF
MTSPIADGVMAATYKLVQQAMRGQWQDVPKTVEQRRVLLDQLTASASPQDQQWLSALQQAMAESDAVVAKIAQAGASSTALPQSMGEGNNNTGEAAAATTGEVDLVGSTLDMIRSR